MRVIVLSLLILSVIFGTISCTKFNDTQALIKSRILSKLSRLALSNRNESSGGLLDPNAPYFHLAYAIQYILLGKPDPTAPDIFTLIDAAPDDVDLVFMIVFGTQNFVQFWETNGYDEDGYEGYY